MSSERQPPDDQDLDAFLAGRSRISQAYREASREESAPAELDANILDAARQAARSKIVRRPRWLAPMALAATLALSLSVLMNISRDPVLREHAGVPSAATTADLSSPTAPAAEASAVEAEILKAEVIPPSAAPRAKNAPPPPPARAPTLAVKPAPQTERSDAVESDRMGTQERRMERKSSAEFGAAMSAPAGMAADIEAPEEALQQRPSATATPTRSVEVWIEDIRALRARGDTEAAESELREFQLAYPDHVLPDDLKPESAD